jgi:hypothetical protein
METMIVGRESMTYRRGRLIFPHSIKRLVLENDPTVNIKNAELAHIGMYICLWPGVIVTNQDGDQLSSILTKKCLPDLEMIDPPR